MMQADFFFEQIRKLNFFEAAASGGDKRIYSNDQHVDVGKNVWAAAGGNGIRNSSACASTEPGATRRDQVPVPFRLHGAVLQRPAGRRGFAAMPAEEHVEPLVELPERGTCRGSACGCARQAGRDRGAEIRSTGGDDRSAG
jgi:hypothetical protein